MFQDDSALCGCQIFVVDVPVEYDIAAVTRFCRLPVVLVQIEGLCRPIWCVTLVHSIRTQNALKSLTNLNGNERQMRGWVDDSIGNAVGTGECAKAFLVRIAELEQRLFCNFMCTGCYSLCSIPPSAFIFRVFLEDFV